MLTHSTRTTTLGHTQKTILALFALFVFTLLGCFTIYAPQAQSLRRRLPASLNPKLPEANLENGWVGENGFANQYAFHCKKARQTAFNLMWSSCIGAYGFFGADACSATKASWAKIKDFKFRYKSADDANKAYIEVSFPDTNWCGLINKTADLTLSKGWKKGKLTRICKVDKTNGNNTPEKHRVKLEFETIGGKHNNPFTKICDVRIYYNKADDRFDVGAAGKNGKKNSFEHFLEAVLNLKLRVKNLDLEIHELTTGKTFFRKNKTTYGPGDAIPPSLIGTYGFILTDKCETKRKIWKCAK